MVSVIRGLNGIIKIEEYLARCWYFSIHFPRNASTHAHTRLIERLLVFVMKNFVASNFYMAVFYLSSSICFLILLIFISRFHSVVQSPLCSRDSSPLFFCSKPLRCTRTRMLLWIVVLCNLSNWHIVWFRMWSVHHLVRTYKILELVLVGCFKLVSTFYQNFTLLF